MPLTDLKIRTAKASEKPYKLSDEKGLYLLVNQAGKYWRFDFRFEGKRKTLALGVYPEVALAAAREKLADARKLLQAEVDPTMHKKIRRTYRITPESESFEAVAREWYARNSERWVGSHGVRIIRRLERDVFPWLGSSHIDRILAPDLLAVLRRIESRGAVETAHRAHQNCSQIFRYAIATGRASRDPAADLRGALPPTKVKHFPSLTDPRKVGELLRVIEGYSGSFVTRSALKLAPLVFVRPGELRKAAWSEIDFDAQEWRIPAIRMKMRAQHIVPLSSQAAAILKELKPLTGDGHFIFPGARTSDRPMSENTVNAALRRLGYTTADMTGHGFRSIASTMLNEQGWNRDAIERQLAHAERDSVRAAYNYAEHLQERRRMMQAWADYLDGLRVSATSGVRSA